MKANIYANITDKRSVPFNSAATGTVTTHGIAIIGVGTAFLTEMPAGSYVVDLTNYEIRKVYRVDSDTLAFMEVALTNDIAGGSTLQIIHKYQTGVKSIYLETTGSAKIDNAAFTGTKTLTKSGAGRSSLRDLVAPIIVDATNTTMQVTIVY